MLPTRHDLETFAHHRQQALLREAENARLVREATAANREAPQVRFAAVRSAVAAALYALADWLDASHAVARGVTPSASASS